MRVWFIVSKIPPNFNKFIEQLCIYWFKLLRITYLFRVGKSLSSISHYNSEIILDAEAFFYKHCRYQLRCLPIDTQRTSSTKKSKRFLLNFFVSGVEWKKQLFLNVSTFFLFSPARSLFLYTVSVITNCCHLFSIIYTVVLIAHNSKCHFCWVENHETQLKFAEE